jgi:hypothetical protein
MPAVDQTICGAWTELDLSYYNRLPYYFEAAMAEKRGDFQTYEPLTDTVAWKPNMGDTMRLVLTEDAPVLTQERRPNRLSTEAKGDYYNVRERTSDAFLTHQKFFSPNFRFLSSFQDFLKGQIGPTRKTIERQIAYFKNQAYRAYMWDYAPYVYVVGYGKVAAPVGRDANGASLKTNAWLQNAVLANIPADGFLSYAAFADMISVAIEEIGMTPYEGEDAPTSGKISLYEKYCATMSREARWQLVNDPWVKENRVISQDLYNSQFQPVPYDQVLSRIEKFPLRWYTDSDMLPALAAPETIDQTTNRTIPNPTYANLAGAVGACSPFEAGAFWGAKGGYRRISVGPPPEYFAGQTTDPAKIAGMDWNGKVYATKNFPIPCVDANGATQLDLNSFGEYMRWQAHLTLGIVGVNTQNYMPFIFRRRRGVSTTGLPGQ